jgi:1,4-dihydroxy-2-naphthoyl-CoA hydrolase
MTAPDTDHPSSRDELSRKLGITVVELSAKRVVAKMPVAGNRQPFGVLHGGAYCVLGETLASMAANEHAGAGRVAFGIDLNATHHRAARDGEVTATAVALHLGATLTSHEVVITDAMGKRLSTVRVTNIIREAPAQR